MATTKSNGGSSPYRFAHPFFTETPVTDRKSISGVGTRMSDFIKTKLESIPKVKGKSIMLLKDVIGAKGAAEIDSHKSISFHALGDSGTPNGEMQERISDFMAKDYHAHSPEKSPAFLLHMGDVDYYDNTARGYHEQFYEPYKKYPGKIIAIPGNHDGELFKGNKGVVSTGQKKTLEAFQENFCRARAGVPEAAGAIYREMVPQPGVYWMLDSNLVNIIGLYSNIAEGPGYLDNGKGDKTQITWLSARLKEVKQKRANGKKSALIISVHHPLYSGGGHEPSREMRDVIDKTCHTVGIMPDAVMSAHAHSYQRFTRYLNFNGVDMEIPYTVCGTGGRKPQPVLKADKRINGDHSFEFSFKGYGHQLVTITDQILAMEFLSVTDSERKLMDTVRVDLSTNKILNH